MTTALTPVRRRVLVIFALASALTGGVVNWITFFDGLGNAAPPIGIAVTFAMILLFARREFAIKSLLFMLAFAFGFVVLTWPILWLVVGFVRYLISGEALGN